MRYHPPVRSCVPLLPVNTPPLKAAVSERMVATVILFARPVFCFFFFFGEKKLVKKDVTAMMALQLKNGDATYYQSAEYCRNYTSPPVSYGDSSHYLNRLPGKERLCHAGSSPPPPLTVSSPCALVYGQRKKSHLKRF